MRTTGTAVMLTAALLGGVPAAAQPADPARVLVMPFAAKVEAGAQGEGAALWIGEAAAVLLAESLASVGVVVLTRDERVAAFERLHLPMSSALTRATMVRVGELVGASDIVFGEVTLAERLEVKVRLIHLDTARELPAIDDRADVSDVFTLFARLGDRVAPSLAAIDSRPAGSRGTAVVVPLPPGTFENYAKGLVAPTPEARQRFLEAAFREAPTDARILMALWRLYGEQGQHDKALAAANAVPLESRFLPRAGLAVALSLVELRRYDGAHQVLTTLSAAGPNPVVANALGVVQLRRGEVEGTPPPSVYFARAVEAAPENTDFLFNLGYAHARAGEPAEALRWLRESVRFDAADGEAHLVMSAVLAGSGRAAEAQRELDLARLLGAGPEPDAASPSPVVPAALERLTSDLDLNAAPRLDAALAAPAQRDQRATAAYHLERGRDLMQGGRDREAIEELRRAVYLAPYEDEPHLLLGRIYARTGRLAAAIDELTVALWCRETLAGRLALGDALLQNGDRDAARREAERALVLSPDSAEARALLDRIDECTAC